MSSSDVLTLRDCTQFRETLDAQPPAVAHAGVLLCVATLAAGLLWGALTPVDLVVRAPGRVRPLEIPTKVYSAVSPHVEGRVVEVRAREGTAVRKGDVLLRLATDRLDHEIAKTSSRLRAAQAELDKLAELAALQKNQFEIARTKAVAERDQAAAEIARARELRESKIRQARIQLELARDQQARVEKLAARHAVSQQETVETNATFNAAQESLRTASVPVDDSRLEVLREAITLVARDYEVRIAELDARIIASKQDADEAVKELADLRRQAAQAVLCSPIDGVVTKGEFHVGDVVALGTPLFEVAARNGYSFEATIPSRDMGLVHDGMPARVKFDAYDYQLYGSLTGKVCFISPDTSRKSGAAAAGRQPAYRVRISLPGDRVGTGAFRGQVKLGMSGRIEIITDRRTVLSILFQRLRSSISFG